MLSLIGSLLGFGTSFLPKVLGYFEQKRDQAHELAMMDKQLEQQLQVGAQRLEATHVEADIREAEALHKEFASITRKASPWVVNLAASVRPVITYCLFIEFAALTWAVFAGKTTEDQYRMIWNGEFQAIWAAVVSFWFGSRTFARLGQGGHT